MKLFKRLLLWSGILLILFLIAASFYIKVYGKALVEQALTAALKKNVVLGEVSYYFPLGLRARNVHVSRSLEGGEFLEAEGVILQMAPQAVYQRRPAFVSVTFIKPSAVIEATKQSAEGAQGQARRYGVIVPPIQTGQPPAGGAPIAKKGRVRERRGEVTIDRLVVRDGRLRYTDGLTEKGFSFNLEDVRLKAGQLVFPPKPGRTSFDLSARLVKEGNPLSGSLVKGHGWIDAVKKDMEAEVEVVEANGTVGLTAEAVSRNNDMEVTGEVKTQNLFLGAGAGKEAPSGASTVNDLILNALSSAGVEIGAKFSFRTEMDDFRLEQVSFSGSVVTK